MFYLLIDLFEDFRNESWIVTKLFISKIGNFLETLNAVISSNTCDLFHIVTRYLCSKFKCNTPTIISTEYSIIIGIYENYYNFFLLLIIRGNINNCLEEYGDRMKANLFHFLHAICHFINSRIKITLWIQWTLVSLNDNNNQTLFLWDFNWDFL